MDDDQAGRSAFQIAKSDGLLDEGDVIFTTRIGKSEAEFEDLFEHDFVKNVLLSKFGVDLDGVAVPPVLRTRKFTDRMRVPFQASGKIWNDAVEAQLKSELARACMQIGVSALDPTAVPIFQTAIRVINAKLGILAQHS